MTEQSDTARATYPAGAPRHVTWLLCDALDAARAERDEYCYHRVNLTLAGECPHCARETWYAELAATGIDPDYGTPFVRRALTEGTGR